MTLRSVVCASCVIASTKLLRAVRRELRVGHLEVEDAVDLQLRVVACVMQIWLGTSSGISRRSCRYATRSTNGMTKLRPGCEHRVEAAEALDDPARAAAARRGSPWR